ncbi:cytochrome P450 6k1-like [Diprion similis]|uniref:cytochrome P450 6k1-like n=1 Tax=Diprion similis TaxID=362088 RepID=UPI001EF8B781|nr:cytochrome P450 6k1-like [Diprion similis]
MGFLSAYLVVDFLALLIAIIFSTYFYMKYVVYNYWSSRNIDYVKPIFPLGNLGPVFAGRRSIGEVFHDAYSKFKGSPVVGLYMFHRPSLVINDPDLIRLVLTKAFGHFMIVVYTPMRRLTPCRCTCLLCLAKSGNT